MTRPARPPRKYPRSVRVNEVLRESIAEELERMDDPRLEFVTITGVEVARDLRNARVYYAALGRQDDEIEAGLKAAAPHLQGVLGREVRMKYVPRLEFQLDPAIETGQRVEDIIRTFNADPASGSDQ